MEASIDNFGGSSRGIQQTFDGGFIESGNFGSIIESCGVYNIFLNKRNESGILEWNKTINWIEDLHLEDVLQTSDGGYIITRFEYIGHNIYLLKTDENGNELWRKTIGGYFVTDFKQTNDGGFIITGQANGDYPTIYLAKTNSFGNITSTFEVSLPNPNRKLEKTINLKGQEVKPQTNQPIIEIYDDGSVEKKVIIE